MKKLSVGALSQTGFLLISLITSLTGIFGCQLADTGRASESSLIGGIWLVEDLEKRGVLDRAQTTIRFDSDERVSGSTGCNSYSASYHLKGNSLRFGPAVATRRACPPAVMDQEQRFTRVLEATTSHRRDGEILWLFNDRSKELARLVRMFRQK